MVKSQSGNGEYDVVAMDAGWTCACPDFESGNACCKHIYAVKYFIRFHDKERRETVILKVSIDDCPDCESRNIKKAGFRHNKSGDVQRFQCKNCGMRFPDNLGFERMRATPDQITIAMNLYFNGESFRKTAHSLLRKKIKVTHVTIQNWVKKYVGLMDRYLGDITPQVGDAWRTDEIEIRIRKDKKFLYAMQDADTRFWLAHMVAGGKGTDDARPMLKDSRNLAGKVPPRSSQTARATSTRHGRRNTVPRTFCTRPACTQGTSTWQAT